MTDRVNKTVLDNGVRVLSLSMPHVRSVSMGVWVGVGARDETVDESGLSHMIEHMIFKGTGRRSAYQIAKEFDAIGGHTNAFTTMESTCYHAKVMDTHLESMVDILADIFLNSLFLEDELARERPVILQEIGMLEDSPDEYVHLLCGRTAWGDDPLGRSILGTRETVSGFDAAGLQSFFRRRYGPERIVIAVAGHIAHRHLLDMVAAAFENVPAIAAASPRVTPHCRSGVAVHPRGLEQVHLCLSAPGLSLVDPRRYAYALLNTIVGGNMSSRLFQEIRERRGLAYAIYSFAAAYADTGMFGVYAGVDPQDVAQTVELILNCLAELSREGVARTELAEAKEHAKGSLLLSLESSDNQMVRLAQNEITFGTFFPVSHVLQQIDAVRAEDLCGLAGELFQPQRFGLTLLGPVPEALDPCRLLPH
jgi:predicted Zn-dependent peptidase